jgi:2-oxoglutarate dehydrogenase E2 component (dihydrolipoamide succinyltransferase)
VTDIRVPKLNNNDAVYTLTDWLIADEQPIAADEAVATLETSKALQDLVCTESGVLQHVVPAGAECAPGDVVGRVVAPGTPRVPEIPQPSSRAYDSGPVITVPAQALIDELDIDLDRVRSLGLKTVRKADVERLVAQADLLVAQAGLAPQAGQGRIATLAPVQQAVARTVQQSHRTIPAAYTVMKIDVGAADEAAQRLSEQLRKIIGLPELLVAAVGTLHGRFPMFFASPLGEDAVRLSDDPHIGVTIDVGNGLYVPVVRDVSRLSFKEIVGVMTGFRQTALQGTFREQDLAGGNIAITLHHDPDVVLAIPLIFPGHTCSLALSGSRQEVTLDSDGCLSTNTVANIGLAYDHRYINGRDATLFLRSLKEVIESPGRLVSP